MKLAAFEKDTDYKTLRDLTSAETVKHEQYKVVISEARNRLNLFKILSYNFQDWRNYLDSLLIRKTNDHDDEMLHLDRLLLNYLTCAYTIREHFEVSFNKRFRKDTSRKTEHDTFLKRLCSESWAFAFFLDFRGHVQHYGLGIGHYARSYNETSVSVTITQDAASLISRNSQARAWTYSKLKGSEGIIELVPLLKEFHIHMLQNYAGFIVQTFFPELIPAGEFYSLLTNEVQSTYPKSRMVFSEREIATRKEGRKTHFKFDLIKVPNDLFLELGISRP